MFGDTQPVGQQASEDRLVPLPAGLGSDRQIHPISLEPDRGGLDGWSTSRGEIAGKTDSPPEPSCLRGRTPFRK